MLYLMNLADVIILSSVDHCEFHHSEITEYCDVIIRHTI